VDGRSDLDSLGATAFFALTGRAPFEAGNVPALLAKHVTEPAPTVQSLRREVPGKLSEAISKCLAKSPPDRYESGEALARAVGELRGRELRAPPLLRKFLRNAEVTTMVFLTVALVQQNAQNTSGLLNFVLIALVVQLGAVARRLLAQGYTFEDIRAALLAEATMMEEEAEAAGSAKFMRWINSIWNRIWAGRFGKFFFRVAGWRLKQPEVPAIPSSNATELVLGRAAEDLYTQLPSGLRERFSEVPGVIRSLERDAERLRRRGETGERLQTTVAALENLRLGMLRLRVGSATAEDLTADLERAREIADEISAQLAARRELKELLR
jgi:serine/threonine-protein kinase